MNYPENAGKYSQIAKKGQAFYVMRLNTRFIAVSHPDSPGKYKFGYLL